VVDVNIPRFNQAVVAVVTGLAFVLQLPMLVTVMAVVLTLSAFGGPRTALLSRLYTSAIRPRLAPGGPTEFETAAPPRFAQRLGAGFLIAATIAFFVSAGIVGWALTLIVTALAALAAATRICVGCILYERLVAS
jgi:hypothetical protein